MNELEEPKLTVEQQLKKVQKKNIKLRRQIKAVMEAFAAMNEAYCNSQCHGRGKPGLNQYQQHTERCNKARKLMKKAEQAYEG